MLHFFTGFAAIWLFEIGYRYQVRSSTVNYQMRATVNGQPWTNASWDNSNLARNLVERFEPARSVLENQAQNLLRAGRVSNSQ